MENSSFKNRNLLVLAFEILLIIVAIGGLTFATSRLLDSSSSAILTFGEYNVDYIGKTEIAVSELEPISDSLINYNTSEDVIRVEFSFRGVDTNENEDLIYDIMLKDINIDCSLLNEYTKWNLYKNGKLLYNGNFDPEFDGNILTDNYRFTETQQDLPKHNQDYDDYVLIIWISEACEDLTNCEYVDQTNIVNSNLDMKLFIAVSTGKKVEYQRVANDNYVCVNKPELYNKMVPVYYDSGNWKVADTTNSDVSKLWYDYGKARWANAVVVNTDKYNNSKVGAIVSEEDILAYYVWIPRYKYKLWNSEELITDSYNAYEKGIEIIFESGVNSSGTVKCIEDKCNSKNNNYLTHPAFSDNLRGFWISKYEISDGNKFIPNASILMNKNLEEYNNIINNLSVDYGLEDIATSHVVTNLEWGSTLYLSHSKYGICDSNGCKSVSVNDSYISEKDKRDTTTSDVYGVYDMAGSTGEYVQGTTGLGSALSEVIIKGNDTWYNGYYNNNYKDYIIRGGVDTGLFNTGDIGMTNVSTRSVFVSK
ncbi:MAG: hypothetical protein IJE89_03440 [Bacilli bacterium]|nr:hypothetical protein [Bacilli bacterium]